MQEKDAVTPETENIEPSAETPETPTPETSEAPKTDIDAAKMEIAAKRLSPEWSELNDWWGTPEGDEIAEKYRSGDWSRERVQDYLDARNRGETHAQAMEAGLSATAKRIGRYIVDWPESYESFMRNPLGMLGQQFAEKREKVGVEGKTGDTLATMWLVGDILWSTVPATAEAVGRMTRGTAAGEDVFHLAEMVIPVLRGTVSRVVARRLAKGTVAIQQAKIMLPGKVWREVLKELDDKQIEKLKQLKIWDGRFSMVEGGIEAVALALEIEELPQELIGTGMMRVFAETGARFYNTDKTSANMWEEALEGAFADYAAEAEVDPDTQQAATPDTEVETDAEADDTDDGADVPDDETQDTEEPETDTGAEAEEDTETEPESDADVEVETDEGDPDAEPETESDAEGTEAGAEPDTEPETETAEPETEPDGEPETESDTETAEAETEAEGEEPDTEDEPETTTYSTAFTELVERIASDPDVQAAQTPELRAAIIDARWRDLWPEIEKLPEYIREGDTFLNLFGNEIEKRIEEIKAENVGDLEGTPNRVVWSSDRKTSYRVTYQLAELDDVQPSHNLDGTKNPNFPPELQPREQRGGAMSLAQIADYAKDIVTDFLLDHFSNLSDGAPLLSRQHPMRVISGNGRTMTLKKAFLEHPDQWQKYQAALKEKASQYGITEAEINAMSKPVLVQVLEEDVNETELADDANKSSGLEITSAEQASRDAKYLTDDVMSLWEFVGGGFEEALNHEKNQDFRTALFKNIPHKEQSGFLASDNQTISAQGIARLRRMMFRYVFQGEYGIKLSQTLIETRFDNLKNINNMLDIAIPYLAKVESYIRSGIRDKAFSIAEELSRAVGTMENMAVNGDKIADMLRQDVLFKPKTSLDQLSVPAIQMLYIMDAKQNAYVQLASVFMRYSEAVMKQDPNQLSMLEAFTKQEFFKKEMFDMLFDAPPEELQAAMAGKSIPDARRIVEEHVDSLISLMEEQAKKRGAEPEPEPEPEPEGEEATDEGEPETEEGEDTEAPDTETDEGEEATEPELTEDEITERVYAAVGEDTHFSEIVNATELTEQQVSTALLRLELDGRVSQHPGKRFRRTEGAEPETEPETEQPTFPEKPTLQLVAYTPASKALRPRRGYIMEEQPETDIWVHKERDGYFVTIHPPGYFAEQIFVSSRAPFTDKTARRVVIEALASEEFAGREWKLDENDPRKDGGVSDPNAAEQARIDRMPSVKEESAFVDGYLYDKRGIAYSMPSLDPSMRLKVIYEGLGKYTVYIETNNLGPYLENLEAEPTRALTPLDDSPILRHSDTDSKGNLYMTRLILRGMRGKNPVDALQRGLAQVFDESVWDELKTDPEAGEASIDRTGVPGNYPQPLPAKIKLVHVPRGMEDRVYYQIADEAGNVNPDYAISVKLDPLDIGDTTIEVTIEFPNHEISAITELADAENTANIEPAVLKTIANLRQYDFGKGGINIPGAEPENSTTESSEALFEDLPPIVTNRERPFGDVSLDSETMQHEGYPKGGNLKIYKFAGSHAPQARVRKMGTKDNPQWEVELRYPRRNAARHVSYAKTAKGAITDAINAIENSDHAWKPLYKQGIFSQLDGIMNAINRRQFASTPAVERRIRGLFYNLRKGLKVDLRGYTISSLKELAILGQVWRHPGLEAHRIVFLDENHQVVGHETVSVGVPGQTVNQKPARVFYHMKRLNAKYFMDMHNHPDGIAEFSDGDKDAARQIYKIYGNAYLGQVVVNSGEYAVSRVVGSRVQHKNRIQFTASDLGWDVGQKPSNAATYALDETAIRPADPLYQYDVDTETGKLLTQHREVQKGGRAPAFTQDKLNEKIDTVLKDMAKLGKYLQTEKNWTTLFFTGYDNEVLAVMDYKDLHLLSAPELYNFIESEARMHGGVHVSAFVGEGDWYQTQQDIMNSPWSEVLSTFGTNVVGLTIGIEHAWFDGLKAEKTSHVIEPRAAVLSMYETPALRGISGDIYETRVDSDYGADTELTKPGEKRTEFVRKLIAAMQGSEANAHKLYEEATGQTFPKAREPLLWSFVQAVANAFARTRQIDPNVDSPIEAKDFYDMLEILSDNTIAHFLDYKTTKNPTIIRANREQGASRSHFTAARLAAITENDRVLTLDDTDGTLATFARNAGARRVETVTTDGYTKMLFDDVLTGVADRVHDMSADNIAREWKGKRPTVILIDAIEYGYHKLDEAMKLLAPGGRVVVVSNSHSWAYAPSNYWSIMSSKYLVRQLDVAEGYYESYGRKRNTEYIIVDKQQGTGRVEPVTITDPDHTKRGDALFNEVEKIKKARAPILEADANIEYEGIERHEQTYTQPMTHPEIPAQFIHQGQLRGLPSDVAEPGSVAGDIAPRPREPLPEIPAEQMTQAPPEPVPVEANGTEFFYTEYGAPLIRTVESNPPPVPDDTPMGLSEKVTQWIRKKQATPEWYARSPQTAKRTLELLGDTGLAVGAGLKRIRNIGDRLTGRGLSVLDVHFPRWKQHVRAYAREQKIPLKEAAAALNQILARHQEGRSKTAVPKLMDDIVKDVTAFFKENIANPMLEMNQQIFRQGLLFEMSESLADDGILENEFRKELERELPDFEEFVKRAGTDKTKGFVQGFVREKATGKMFAVFVKSDTYHDPKTHKIEMIPGSDTYRLESPFGEERDGEFLMLHGTHRDYELIATRDPRRRNWTGDRDVAKHLWDAELTNSPRPDVLAEYFAENGIQLPEGVRLKYAKVANVEEWSLRKEGVELYRIRRLTPITEKIISTPQGKVEQIVEADPAYDAFKNKLLVYKSGQVRNPIFIYRGRVPHKVWQPIDNYYPHTVDWNDMSPDPNDSVKYANFVKFAEDMAAIQSNNMDVDMAKAFLTQRIIESKTRKYGHLEQDRQYNYPVYNRNFFQVWEQYITRAGHRMQTIREFGQANDLLYATLNEFIAEDTLTESLNDSENAVLKLRFFAGYRDFVPDAGSPSVPFRDDTGNPIEIMPYADDFIGMSPQDWQTLVDAGILEVTDAGNYRATTGGIAMLENPAFLHGALAEGLKNLSIASDVVKNQLGWRQGDMFDEYFSDMVRGMRTWTGILYLGRAWASNIAQPVNTGIVMGPKALLKSMLQHLDPKHRAYAKETGAVAIDVMHDYAGSATLGNRVIRQMLGAIPKYQVGRATTPRALLPTRGAIEDMGVRTTAWTPFYAVEGFNRRTAALAARAFAVSQIRKMLRKPKGAKTAREMLLSLPGAYTLKPKLEAALSVPNLTPKSVEQVASMLENEVREHAPHLFPVYDFLAEFAKETADWTQHRVEAMDRGRPWTRHSIFIMMQQLQSFNFAQTKFVKDAIIREWEIAHQFLKERASIENKTIARVMGTLWFLPRVVLWSGMFGFGAEILGRIVRFQVPDEDSISLLTWLYKAGMYTQIGEYITQFTRFNRGAEEAFLGPTLGTAADFIADPGKTAARLARPPLAGPSVKQIMDWVESDDVVIRRSTKRGGRRTPAQRRTIRR